MDDEEDDASFEPDLFAYLREGTCMRLRRGAITREHARDLFIQDGGLTADFDAEFPAHG